MYLFKIQTSFKDCEVVEVDYDKELGTTDLNKLKEAVDEDTACVLVQNPNFFGMIEDIDEIGQIAHDKKAMYVLSVNPITLSILKSPGEVGADVAVGDAQPLGNALNYGGPYVGFLAIKSGLIRKMPGRVVGQTGEVGADVAVGDAQPLGNALNYGGPYVGFLAIKSGLIRKMPGRVVGQTVDRDGSRCYCLTLQTREQHVRREKATSNICSNQGLNALSAAIYLATMGKKGFQEVAMQNMQKSHYTANKITESGKFTPLFKGKFFNEFVVKSPINIEELNEKLLDNKIIGGYDLSKDYPELDGCTLFKGKFFNEFVVKSPINIEELNEKLLDNKIIGGYDLSKDYPELDGCTLICVTEKRSVEEIDRLIGIMEGM